MFNIIELLFPVSFILIFIMIIFTFAKGISAWNTNNGSEYGKLAESDEGKLTFQGTRYLQFN